MLITEKITNFADKINHSLPKEKITVLQINLGRKCNLACIHCHVEASPKRKEELTPEICQQLVKIINKFSQIKTVDLTGGAPEMHYGFKELVEAARSNNKEVIVRSNLTIFFESSYEYLPEYFVKNQVRVVASLPCYLEDNVDKQRGNGVYNKSILALQKLNELGYGIDCSLIIDLVYNPPLPKNNNFRLTPNQKNLEKDYKKYLADNFNIYFNSLLTITNLPVGRTNFYLDKYEIKDNYLQFLEANFNYNTLPNLMCRNQLSIDYLGNIYDCDFNQMTNTYSLSNNQKRLTVSQILKENNLDLISQIQTPNHCYGCTAGSGSSCGGSLTNV
ncbi:arsenosugar biosynthesis radical SAM (seleno)protein ArsS [Geminocystis sp. NIES-3709]|uniref:arsenosugar biosynthesis radical SAM (seleno)protein ArsS n=1 Tax=Geminocystis sp. NIES-3709 TaxID=1617448 RepID=UPI0005FCA354|nr:arsenosugar biosynthesis radical SAM (seleno)protein ArsS [Geminocystis sp. NIES-3709]BAQ64453.1 Fe-S oxidoreductases of moaA/nifB/pqqE family [Geminocystis sp. NIES-3709]